MSVTVGTTIRSTNMSATAVTIITSMNTDADVVAAVVMIIPIVTAKNLPSL